MPYKRYLEWNPPTHLTSVRDPEVQQLTRQVRAIVGHAYHLSLELDATLAQLLRFVEKDASEKEMP